MRLPVFGGSIVIGETDIHNNCVVAGIMNNTTGKGIGFVVDAVCEEVVDFEMSYTPPVAIKYIKSIDLWT
ncbi:MAG: hypothetical protein PHZ02_01530 [Desulfocapsaceae bacterium]|nr:hypothetical protein [Desulfocapsaceae bacterium]